MRIIEAITRRVRPTSTEIPSGKLNKVLRTTSRTDYIESLRQNYGGCRNPDSAFNKMMDGEVPLPPGTYIR